MVALRSRQGRQLQRYNSNGYRLVVGCIPYRLKKEEGKISDDQVLEILVITSQKGHGMMFPKGGWEIDESMKQAAFREAMEEAGVIGTIEFDLGKWFYTSKRNNNFHEGFMFGLNVTKELLQWPEMGTRKRKWVTVEEVRTGCQHQWMTEALERLVASLPVQVDIKVLKSFIKIDHVSM
ncbi:NAD(+) diphosphatase protein [Dioscorea alata]|uniref:NAD(+) diphosphatase protein n=1 Tax=Dioscorea alata TaxID=55571 RepID=A0ACB7U6W8_DIOAL|nr:NAD(+) diphosphatase protein [Dioscorea alata]